MRYLKMRKYLILLGIVILSFFSCDLGMVKLMDKKEYGKETGMGVKDVEFSLSTNSKTYLGTSKVKIYLNVDRGVYLNNSYAQDLEISIRKNLKLVNANLNSVYSFYSNPDYNYVASDKTKATVTITLTPTGDGDIEVTIPKETVFLPYDEDRYIDCYNKEASKTLVIKPDLLYPYYEAGLQIGGVCSISSHEYLAVDTYNDKMYLIDSSNSSVIDEGSISCSDIKKIKYCKSENKVYILETSSDNLHIIDIHTMTSISKPIPISTSSYDNCSLEIDPNSRRIYIKSFYSNLYSLDMDDYSVKMNGTELESYIDHITLDAANNLLYASKSNYTYKYSIAGDTLSGELLHSSSSQGHSGITINGDGSNIYYSCNENLYTINTSDLTETSFEISGYVVAILPEYDLYFTKEYSYPNDLFGKYRISDHSLSSSRDLDDMEDAYSINTDGTEALVYSSSDYSGVSCDIVKFVDLK